MGRGVPNEMERKQWVIDYLAALGLEQSEADYTFLCRLCTAHLNTFPFENVSKLLDYRDCEERPAAIVFEEKFIQRYDTYHFGGTCYAQNGNLQRLLTELGYDCYYVMLSKQHIGIVVILPEREGEKVYVDVGAAAPFFKPVHFESEPDNVSRFGTDQVYIRSRKGTANTYTYQRFTNGKQNGEIWEFDAEQRYDFSAFEPIIAKTYEPGSTFMSILRCQIWQLDQKRSVSLVNNQFGIRYADGSKTSYTLNSTAEIERVLIDEFDLPKLPVREAIEVLEEMGVDIFSGK